MANKKLRPDVLSDGLKIVGGKDGRKIIETPKEVVKNPSSVPGKDESCHAFITGAGKKRFDGVK
jgi:hypothetical protein